jgi:putative oxidoreductase
MSLLSLSGLAKWKGVAPLALRLAVGAVFIAHGMTKFQSPAGTAAWFGSLGIPMPELMMWVVTVVEVIGGICMLLGVLTRLWGVLQAIDMLTAIVLVTSKGGLLYKPDQKGSSELELMLLGGAVALALMGAGKVSVDQLLGLNAADDRPR